MHGYKTYIVAGVGFMLALLDAIHAALVAGAPISRETVLAMVVSAGIATLRHGSKTDADKAATQAVLNAVPKEYEHQIPKVSNSTGLESLTAGEVGKVRRLLAAVEKQRERKA